MNPIEQMWSKVKNKLRKYQATEPEALFTVIMESFHYITDEDAKGWFEGCGYFQ